MYGDGICWLEGWKVSKCVADGVLLNQLIRIIIIINTVLLTLNINRPTC